jgi:S-adenosylmethionine hydrolase
MQLRQSKKHKKKKAHTELNMSNSIITLTTDFGLRDPYVAEMKAVILGISPVAKIVDITHQIEKFNTRMGAYVLAAASQYFPKDTIHAVVVDPGVGTRREAILIQTKQHYFVGPNNGVLALTAKSQGIKHVYKIANPKLMLPKISHTFHGRDIFAPAAAHLAKGTPPPEFGPEIHRIVTPKFAKITKKRNMLIGEVIHIDDFGNIVTNFREKEIESMEIKIMVNLKLKSTKLKLRLCKAYAEVEVQQPLAIIGSHNFLEISINQGNAAEEFKTKAGDKVTLYRS